jgi:hypothetical protein
MFTAIRAETVHSPTYQLLRGEIKKRGGRSPGSGNQVITGRNRAQKIDMVRLAAGLNLQVIAGFWFPVSGGLWVCR